MSLNLNEQMSQTNEQVHLKKDINDIRPWLYKPKKSRFGTRRNFKFNSQHWTSQQTFKYAQFITLYMDLVKGDANQKRKFHLNRILSKFIGTRSPVQCRSHHQRMIKMYGNPQNILKQLGGPLSKMEREKNLNNLESDQFGKKSGQYLTLPDFSLHPFLINQGEDEQVSLHLLDSNEIILPQRTDMYEF